MIYVVTLSYNRFCLFITKRYSTFQSFDVLLHHYRALVDSKTSSTDEKEGSKDRTESMQLGDELQMGGTTSGGESGGSPITVLRMQMQDEVKKETETQTEKQAIEDKETTITAEELNEMAGKECRETQVTHILNKRFVHIHHYI